MRRFVLSAAWLGFLTIVILAGVPYVSYHGDETSQLFDSHDYATLFLKGDPRALWVEWPIDNDLEYDRIANSTTSRYTVGLAWHLAGYTESDLPDRNFNWSLDYYGNRALGLIPDWNPMVTIRLPSALFLVLSAFVMFAIGYQFGGLPMAFFVSGLYALNPIVLLNGRRALQEGALLFFGLLTVWIGMVMAQRRERGQPIRWPWWVALTVAGALALVSKNNGFLYICAAYLWVFLPELSRPRLLRMVRAGTRLLISGLLLIALYVALSPGLWSDPVARMKDATAARLGAMTGQMRDDPEAPSSMDRRISDIITQPFLRPEAHYESGYSSTYIAQRDLVAAYDSSWISGIHFGALLGLPLTLLAAFGIVANFLPRLRPYRSKALSFGLLVWLILNVGVLLWLPLPWQRYFLSLIPIMTIFAAVGLWSLVRLVRALLPGSGLQMALWHG